MKQLGPLIRLLRETPDFCGQRLASLPGMGLLVERHFGPFFDDFDSDDAGSDNGTTPSHDKSKNNSWWVDLDDGLRTITGRFEPKDPSIYTYAPRNPFYEALLGATNDKRDNVMHIGGFFWWVGRSLSSMASSEDTKRRDPNNPFADSLGLGAHIPNQRVDVLVAMEDMARECALFFLWSLGGVAKGKHSKMRNHMVDEITNIETCRLLSTRNCVTTCSHTIHRMVEKSFLESKPDIHGRLIGREESGNISVFPNAHIKAHRLWLNLFMEGAFGPHKLPDVPQVGGITGVSFLDTSRDDLLHDGSSFLDTLSDLMYLHQHYLRNEKPLLHHETLESFRDVLFLERSRNAYRNQPARAQEMRQALSLVESLLLEEKNHLPDETPNDTKRKTLSPSRTI